ncbi:hypothetical protein ACLB2K_073026 [Fragaria x ananassa]
MYVPPEAVMEKIECLWLPNNWFCFEFTREGDVHSILERRPWYIRGRLFKVQRYTLDFDPTVAIIDKLVVWIRLSNLPLPHWNTKSLQHLVQHLGQFIKADDMTLMAQKCMFARVKVELDLRFPLKRTIIAHGNDGRSLTILVSYEVIFEVSFRCGLYRTRGMFALCK